MTDGAGLAGRRVLVAEDQPIVALDLERTLRGWGCAVLGPAGSNLEALDLLRQGRCPPDAALLDAKLADGWAVPAAEALAAAGMPFALLSGCDDPGRAAPGLRGAAAVLAKPWARADLRRLLGRLLDPAPTAA